MNLLKIVESNNLAKSRFQSIIKKSKLYHSTSRSSASRILKQGFRAKFGINDPAWIDNGVDLMVHGRDVFMNVVPDPEHLIDHPSIEKSNFLVASNSSLISILLPLH